MPLHGGMRATPKSGALWGPSSPRTTGGLLRGGRSPPGLWPVGKRGAVACETVTWGSSHSNHRAPETSPRDPTGGREHGFSRISFTLRATERDRHCERLLIFMKRGKMTSTRDCDPFLNEGEMTCFFPLRKKSASFINQLVAVFSLKKDKVALGPLSS